MPSVCCCVTLLLNPVLFHLVLFGQAARHASVQDRPVQTGSDVRCAGPQPSQSGAVLRISFAD